VGRSGFFRLDLASAPSGFTSPGAPWSFPRAPRVRGPPHRLMEARNDCRPSPPRRSVVAGSTLPGLRQGRPWPYGGRVPPPDGWGRSGFMHATYPQGQARHCCGLCIRVSRLLAGSRTIHVDFPFRPTFDDFFVLSRPFWLLPFSRRALQLRMMLPVNPFARTNCDFL